MVVGVAVREEETCRILSDLPLMESTVECATRHRQQENGKEERTFLSALRRPVYPLTSVSGHSRSLSFRMLYYMAASLVR